VKWRCQWKVAKEIISKIQAKLINLLIVFRITSKIKAPSLKSSAFWSEIHLDSICEYNGNSVVLSYAPVKVHGFGPIAILKSSKLTRNTTGPDGLSTIIDHTCKCVL
jgi:hypothetical protein